MKEAIDKYWNFRLTECKKALEKNNFEAYIAETSAEAKQIVLERIIPGSGAETFGYAGSLTVEGLGILDALRNDPEVKVVETFGVPSKDREEVMERARHALIVDVFITGTNAITETGILVNLDMWGNRVGAMAYGPKNVLIITGRNKLVPDLQEAMDRIKNYAAPVNAIRHDMKRPRKTPCVTTSYCGDCEGDWRICNTWVINEKSFPKGRIKVVLINEDLGY
jgi:L-lactate utilization protein LutB